MTPSAGLNEYRQVEVGTAEQGKLILKLYDGAISHLKKSADAMNAGDMFAKGEHIVRTQDILMELVVALDLDTGKIAENLQSLYLFMYRYLNEANLQKSTRHIEEVIRILSQLQDTWNQAIDKVSREGFQQAEAYDAVAVVA